MTSEINKTSAKLETLIRARYPVILCQSFEETRVEKIVFQVLQKRGGVPLIWTRTKGFVDSDYQVVEKILAPDKALDYIEQKKGKVCFLLKDFHPYLKDPGVVRKLRDLCYSLKLSQKNIVLISPTMKLPQELTKEVALLDIPLPNRDEIREIYDRIPSDLDVSLQSTPEKKALCVEAALGLTYEEIENIFAKSLVKNRDISVDEILTEKRQIVQKEGILDFIPVEGGFDSIGGLSHLKTWLKRRQHGFSQDARDNNLPPPKGVLMVGLPGCGKSLTAQCVGASWKMPLLRLDIGKIFSGLVGSSEQNMRAALKTAESVSPCILWIDEIEKGLSGSGGGGGDGGTTTRVFGTFLTWMQEKKSPVFVLATANDISSLPPELLRKGRFDEIFYVDLPSVKDRKDIINIHMKKRNWNIANFNEDEYLHYSENFSGAEIEQALIDAKFEAFYEKRDLQMKDLINSLKTTVPLSKTMKEKIDHIRSWAKERAVSASGTEEGITEGNEKRKIEVSI